MIVTSGNQQERRALIVLKIDGSCGMRIEVGESGLEQDVIGTGHCVAPRHLPAALLPAMRKPQEAHTLFLDYVALSLTAHMAYAYGAVNATAGVPRGGLAPWQERRAKELMSASLQEEIPLSLLAKECGLSVRHFARAFRVSTGLPPHRWLLRRRVDHARELLRSRALSLADVALFCGFADQSHFTRVSTAVVGISPGAWCRTNSIQLG